MSLVDENFQKKKFAVFTYRSRTFCLKISHFLLFFNEYDWATVAISNDMFKRYF